MIRIIQTREVNGKIEAKALMDTGREHEFIELPIIKSFPNRWSHARALDHVVTNLCPDQTKWIGERLGNGYIFLRNEDGMYNKFEVSQPITAIEA